MPLNPFKTCLSLQLIPLVYFQKNVLNDVLVLHRFAGRCLPSISAPVNIPRGDAVNGISAVGDDYDVSIPWDDLERSQDCSELSTLICLPGTW